MPQPSRPLAVYLAAGSIFAALAARGLLLPLRVHELGGDKVQVGLLFTVFTRVHDAQIATVWHDDRKIAEMQRGLLTRAARELGEEVLGKVRRLAARHAPPATVGEHEEQCVPRA